MMVFNLVPCIYWKDGMNAIFAPVAFRYSYRTVISMMKELIPDKEKTDINVQYKTTNEQ